MNGHHKGRLIKRIKFRYLNIILENIQTKLLTFPDWVETLLEAELNNLRGQQELF